MASFHTNQPKGPLAEYLRTQAAKAAPSSAGTVGAARVTHTVRPGETPKQIAAARGVDWQALVAANQRLGVKALPARERGTGRTLYTFLSPKEGGGYKAGVQLVVPTIRHARSAGQVGFAGETCWTGWCSGSGEHCVDDAYGDGIPRCMLKPAETYIDLDKVCGPGEVMDPIKGCVIKDKDVSKCRGVADACSSGSQCCSGNCIAGKCQLFSQTQPPPCEPGTYWDGQACVGNVEPPPPTKTCPTGQHLENGACVMDTPPPGESSAWWPYVLLGTVGAAVVVGGVWYANKENKRTA